MREEEASWDCFEDFCPPVSRNKPLNYQQSLLQRSVYNMTGEKRKIFQEKEIRGFVA